MSEKKELSLTDVLSMSHDEFQDYFSETSSVVVVPPEGYVIDFSSIDNLEDALLVIQFLATLILPKTLFMDDREFRNHPLKHLLIKVQT